MWNLKSANNEHKANKVRWRCKAIRTTSFKYKTVKRTGWKNRVAVILMRCKIGLLKNSPNVYRLLCVRFTFCPFVQHHFKLKWPTIFHLHSRVGYNFYFYCHLYECERFFEIEFVQSIHKKLKIKYQDYLRSCNKKDNRPKNHVFQPFLKESRSIL